MCGICGQVSFTDRPVNPEVIRRMSATLAHRGPDDEGYYTEPRVGLGMRRLSVVDLETGQQPIANEDRSIWIVFNGEIYNHQELRRRLQGQGHRFTTRSDTEVVVHLYEEMGPSCVEQLNGMFGLAIWDAKQRQLLLARDPLGIKPLYYALREGQIWFASELKALRANPDVSLTIDPQAIADYLTWLYIPAPYTIVQEIQKLPPASRLVISARGVRLDRYWQPVFSSGASTDTIDSAAEELLETLRRAVRRQLVADVPVGMFLSGGVDSSGVVALAREATSGPLHTFSAGFPGMGLYDESADAREVAARFDCEHHALQITPSAVEALDLLVRACDEPFGDSSAIPLYYVAKFARQHVTVALSGTGGDDLFAGYRRYALARWLPRYQRLPRPLRTWMGRASTWLPAHRRSAWGQWGLYARRFCQAGRNGATPLEAYLTTLMCCDAPLRQALLGTETSGHAPTPPSASPGENLLELFLRTDLETYLPDDLLVKEDRMTMAVGLEARVPFLDREVVEVALRMRACLKLRGSTTKYVLRQALQRVLPSDIVRRPKHGFAVPVSEWLRTELADRFQDTVLSHQAASRPWIKQAAARALFERHRRREDDAGQPLWALLVLEAWCREARG